MFSTQFFDDLSIEEYPVLIGITRLFQEDNDGLLTSEYQFKLLLKGDTLIRNQNKVTSQMLLNELVNFKEECNENEQALVSYGYLSVENKKPFEGIKRNIERSVYLLFISF
jgi:hypothetical protein